MYKIMRENGGKMNDCFISGDGEVTFFGTPRSRKVDKFDKSMYVNIPKKFWHERTLAKKYKVTLKPIE